MKSLDYAWAFARRQGKSFPYECIAELYIVFHGPVKTFLASALRLWLQSDNAVKEGRNSFIHKLLCLLTQGGYFRQTTGAYLEVGHTHEDVGWVVVNFAELLNITL